MKYCLVQRTTNGITHYNIVNSENKSVGWKLNIHDLSCHFNARWAKDSHQEYSFQNLKNQSRHIVLMESNTPITIKTIEEKCPELFI